MREVYILGVGMTPFGTYLDKTHDDLTATAVRSALADCGAATESIGMAIYGSVVQPALSGNYVVPGQFALRKMGIATIPVLNVENACASSSSALSIAYDYVRTGLADVVLAVGVEKLNTEDRDARFKVFNQPADIAQAESFLERNGPRLAPLEVQVDKSGPRSILMDSYAASARLHMQRFGSTQRQLAAVAAKNHCHSVHNPMAHFRKPFTIDEVLAGRAVSYPLTVPMCAPISDGASAVIVCSKEAAKRHPNATPVRVLACVLRSGSNREVDDLDHHVTRIASNAAYEMAGIGPSDLSVAEVHDASAYGEIAETEALGLCTFGEGGVIAERGDTTVGGRIPVNPSGGLESRGHPLGATGLAQIYELTQQLRGRASGRQVENARFAIAQNGGGFIEVEEAACCVTILGRAG